jgi:hypothetical protein
MSSIRRGLAPAWALPCERACKKSRNIESTPKNAACARRVPIARNAATCCSPWPRPGALSRRGESARWRGKAIANQTEAGKRSRLAGWPGVSAPSRAQQPPILTREEKTKTRLDGESTPPSPRPPKAAASIIGIRSEPGFVRWSQSARRSAAIRSHPSLPAGRARTRRKTLRIDAKRKNARGWQWRLATLADSESGVPDSACPKVTINGQIGSLHRRGR